MKQQPLAQRHARPRKTGKPLRAVKPRELVGGQRRLQADAVLGQLARQVRERERHALQLVHGRTNVDLLRRIHHLFRDEGNAHVARHRDGRHGEPPSIPLRERLQVALPVADAHVVEQHPVAELVLVRLRIVRIAPHLDAQAAADVLRPRLERAAKCLPALADRRQAHSRQPVFSPLPVVVADKCARRDAHVLRCAAQIDRELVRRVRTHLEAGQPTSRRRADPGVGVDDIRSRRRVLLDRDDFELAALVPRELFGKQRQPPRPVPVRHALGGELRLIAHVAVQDETLRARRPSSSSGFRTSRCRRTTPAGRSSPSRGRS